MPESPLDAFLDTFYYYTGLPPSRGPLGKARALIEEEQRLHKDALERRVKELEANASALPVLLPLSSGSSPAPSSAPSSKSEQPESAKYVSQFESEQAFLQRLNESGKPALVALCVNGFFPCVLFKEHFYRAAMEFHDSVDFVWVKCKKAEAFCRSRKPDRFPHVELFQAKKDITPGKSKITIIEMVEDDSFYGIRECLRRHGALESHGYHSDGRARR